MVADLEEDSGTFEETEVAEADAMACTQTQTKTKISVVQVTTSLKTGEVFRIVSETESKGMPSIRTIMDNKVPLLKQTFSLLVTMDSLPT